MVDRDKNRSIGSLDSDYSIESENEASAAIATALGSASSQVFPSSNEELSLASLDQVLQSSTNALNRDEDGTRLILDENSSRPAPLKRPASPIVKRRASMSNAASSDTISTVRKGKAIITREKSEHIRMSHFSNATMPRNFSQATDKGEKGATGDTVKNDAATDEAAKATVILPKICLPSARVDCGCPNHLSMAVAEVVLKGIDAKQFFHLHFQSAGAEFMTEFLKKRGGSGMKGRGTRHHGLSLSDCGGGCQVIHLSSGRLTRMASANAKLSTACLSRHQ